jgi:hypothetical protein
VTITTTSDQAIAYGNGAQTVFNYNFLVQNKAECTLYHTTGGSTQSVDAAAWTIAGLGSASGGTFTYPLTGSMPTGDTAALIRRVPATQPTVFANQGAMYPSSVENAIDHVAAAVQDTLAQVMRSVRAPDYDPVMNILPSAAARANTTFGWDANGQPTSRPWTYTTSAGPVPIGIYNWLLVDSFFPTAVPGRVEGTSDDTPAFQAVCTQLAATGGIAWMSPRLYRCDNQINQTSPIQWFGAGASRGYGDTVGTPVQIATGTRIWHNSNTVSLFSLTGFTTTQGSAFKDFTVFETQPTITTGWAPTDRPWVFNIYGIGGECLFDNVHLHNVSRGISAVGTGRMNLQYLTGQPLIQGLYFDQCYDACYASRIHFWPYWSSFAPVMAYTYASTTSIYLGRLDGWFATNVFCLGYKTDVEFGQTASGTSTRGWIGTLYGDESAHALLISGTGMIIQIDKLVGNGTTPVDATTASPTAVPLSITGNSNRVFVDNIDIINCYGTAFSITGTGNQVNVDNVTVELYNVGNVGAYAVTVGAGNTLNFDQPPAASSTYPTGIVTAATGASYTLPVQTSMLINHVNYPKFAGGGSGSAQGAETKLLNYSLGTDTAIPWGIYATGAGQPVKLGNNATVTTLSVTTYDGGAGVYLDAFSPSDAIMNLRSHGNANVQVGNGNGTAAYFYAPASAAVYAYITSNIAGSAAIYTAFAGGGSASAILAGVGAGSAILGATGGNLGFFGSAGSAKPTMPAAATDLPTAITLLNALRQALINSGYTN